MSARHAGASASLAGALLAALLLAGCAPRAAVPQQITVVLRYDDYSAKSDSELEARLFDVFRQQGLTLTVGVIPFVTAGDMTDPAPQALLPLGADKAALLRDALADGAIEVGLHGYSHQTRDAMRMSEFEGLDAAAQRERLTLGKQALEEAIGAPVTLFMPPWNTYDRRTLEALQALGFTTLSADLRGEVALQDALSYVPFTCYPADLQTTLDAARTSGDPAPLVVVLVHSYDLTEANPWRGIISLPGLSELLDALQQQQDVRVLSVQQAAAAATLGAARAQLNRSAIAWSDLSILRAQVQVADHTFLTSTPVLRDQARGRALLWYAAILALGAVGGLLLGRWTAAKWVRLWAPLLSASTLGALLVTLYAVRDLRLYWRGMTLAAMAVGACVGLWLLYLRRRRALHASE